jgi:hypothetical protein
MFPKGSIPVDHVEPRRWQELPSDGVVGMSPKMHIPEVHPFFVSPQAARRAGSFLTLLRLFFTLPTQNARRLGGSLSIEVGVACAW